MENSCETDNISENKQKGSVSLFLKYLAALILAVAAAFHIYSVCAKNISVLASVNGKKIGIVNSISDVESAILSVKSGYSGNTDLSDVDFNVTYKLVLTDKPSAVSKADIRSFLSDYIDQNYEDAYALSVDGKIIAACPDEYELRLAASLMKSKICESILSEEDGAEYIKLNNDIKVYRLICRKDRLVGIDELYDMLQITSNSFKNNISSKAEETDGMRVSALYGAGKPSSVNNIDSGLLKTDKDSSVAVFSAISSSLAARLNIDINYCTVKTESYSEIVQYRTEYIEDDELYADRLILENEGADGLSEFTYEITLFEGTEVSREVIDEKVIIEPVNRVYRIGTKPIPDAVPTGTFIWPINTDFIKITSVFGINRPEFDGGSYHYGIDLAGRRGDPVYAADGGTVKFAGKYSSYGLLVIIDHGNKLSYYGHLDKILVKAGDKVYQGQPVGLMGDTGVATGVHLHFEIRVNGYIVNPLSYLPKLS
ncbi:MAG: peptidoglycan DD-metalloendopeptidase family protein [Firmicutes bacterium]|nr:peptidoglycan DD-metalloendopeptidase family protein [Bacillota bacterium]